jgi:ribosomal protein S18 acetylase RimI-like enzyme
VAAEPDSYWQDWTAQLAEPNRNVFAARDGEEYVGLVGARMDEDRVGHIGTMWVAPAYRGKGVSRRLITVALTFLDEAGTERTLLTATETSTAAVALYQSAGFEMTGRSEPLRPGSQLANLEMARPSPAE